MKCAKILVVESESASGDYLRKVLQQLGYRVTNVARHADEAFESLRREQPDLVLLDPALVGAVDGFDLAARLRVEHRLPFVFALSVDPSVVARAKIVRPHGYIIKPFDASRIYVALEMALARAAADPGTGCCPQPSRRGQMAAGSFSNSLD